MLHPTRIFAENSKTIKFYYNDSAIIFLDNTYRVKTTIYKYRDVDYISKPHSFKVIKIELFDIQSNSSTSASSHPNSHGGLITSVANILQNIEKSYDKGNFYYRIHIYYITPISVL